MSNSAFIFFFFQAEDGIRDGHVTGVQTCALPICRHLTGNAGVALFAAVLYLISFAVPNFQLAGLIDSGESLFMLALASLLLLRRWWLLPLCGIGGALAKETLCHLRRFSP